MYLANVDHGADHLRFVGVREAVREADCEILLEEKRLPRDYRERKKCYQDFLKYVGTDTALFFSTDFNAAEMISFLHRNHVKIPDEISVAGMDDDVFASIVYPQPYYYSCEGRRESRDCSRGTDEADKRRRMRKERIQDNSTAYKKGKC